MSNFQSIPRLGSTERSWWGSAAAVSHSQLVLLPQMYFLTDTFWSVQHRDRDQPVTAKTKPQPSSSMSRMHIFYESRLFVLLHSWWPLCWSHLKILTCVRAELKSRARSVSIRDWMAVSVLVWALSDRHTSSWPSFPVSASLRQLSRTASSSDMLVTLETDTWFIRSSQHSILQPEVHKRLLRSEKD